MKKYKVSVNGTDYEVTLEEISTSGAPARAAAPAPRPAAPVHAAAPTPVLKAPVSVPKAPVAAASVSSAAAGNGEQITSPMPGNIWKVFVQNGQAVKKDDVLLILEAMKMENEIFAPRDGVVQSVNVAEGNAVNSGDLLCVIQ